MPTSSAERGFSLIEIVMTVAIMAMVIGIAGVSMRPVTEAMLLSAETRDVASWLERTRHVALTSARSTTAVIAGADREEAGAHSRIKRLKTPVRIDGDTPAAAVTYHADGSADATRIVLVVAGRRSAIDVDGITGKLRITEQLDAR
jgi:prepilin-type N-terminal cleavage/methylation domain-containing protein